MFSLYLDSIIGNMVRVDENGMPCTFEARNLMENQKYDFWVTASTAVGEGELNSSLSYDMKHVRIVIISK